jgi:hypothetical protein
MSTWLIFERLKIGKNTLYELKLIRNTTVA